MRVKYIYVVQKTFQKHLALLREPKSFTLLNNFKDRKDAPNMTNSTDEKDITELFARIADHFSTNADDGAKAMFAMLVKTTLSQRDSLVHLGEEPLSVGEVREGLGSFMEVLKTHSIPDGLAPRIKNLVMAWLEELKNMKQN